jgi:hypothetical protein
MKNKFNCDWYSVNSNSDNKMLKESLDDNGHWGYTRWGIGMNKGKVFIVDLDDTGETWREMWYCDKVKSVEEVVKIGIECGVIEEYDDGELYCEWESSEEENKKFDDMIGKKVVCGELYNFIGKK